MKKIQYEITGNIELQYDESSPEFQEALRGYNDVIDSSGTKDDMLKHVAFYVTRFGHEGMVEGVGYVGYNGRPYSGELYSGVIVSKNYDEFNFEEM